MSQHWQTHTIRGRDIWSIDDVIRVNEDAGQHFFDRSSMRFFRGRVLQDVYAGPAGVWFVTSEQYESSTGQCAARMYTVRRLNEDGSIGGLGEFNTIGTAHRAKKMARLAAAGIVTSAETEGSDRYEKVTCMDCMGKGSRYEMVVHRDNSMPRCIDCLSKHRFTTPTKESN